MALDFMTDCRIVSALARFSAIFLARDSYQSGAGQYFARPAKIKLSPVFRLHFPYSRGTETKGDGEWRLGGRRKIWL
jgi:hypothetical protein